MYKSKVLEKFTKIFSKKNHEHDWGEAEEAPANTFLATKINGFDVYSFTCKSCGETTVVKQHWEVTESYGAPTM